MNKKLFSEAMTEVNDKYYEEAACYQHRGNRTVWLKWGTMAAVLCFLISGTAALLNHGIRNTRVDEKPPVGSSDTTGTLVQGQPETALPLLTVTYNSSESMGFEGYMAYDISELINANPWNEEMELSTMPVFKNPLTYDTNYIATGADFDKMREFLLDIAGRFGLDANTLTITDDVPDEETMRKINEKLQIDGDPVPDGYFAPTSLIIKADGLEIEVNQAMTAKISFDPAVPLPVEYNFTHHAPYEDIVAVAEYLKTEYKEMIDIDDPQVNIYDGSYNIYAQQGYSIEFFDASGNDTEQILNYNFNRTAFYCDDEGKLFLARIYQPDLSENVGDYPIITLKEASELLSNGNYITTVPYEMPGSEYVKKGELIYLTREQEEYYMPYYRFYVELPEEKREYGLKDYGAYYVPAVREEYIANMPTWDGNFN